jgi:hypothetical protein
MAWEGAGRTESGIPITPIQIRTAVPPDYNIVALMLPNVLGPRLDYCH